MPDPRQTILPSVVRVLLSLALFGVAAEGSVRWLHPRPRIQVVDPGTSALVITEEAGQPLWHGAHESGWLRPMDCAPDDRRVVLAGDSILHTTAPGQRQRSFANLLRRSLRQDPGDVCVVDGSAGGYLPNQQALVVRSAHEAHPADLALVSVWKQDTRYQRVGPVWADSERLVGTDGVPEPPLPLPGVLHRAALQLSAAWRYATLALARPTEPSRPPGEAYADLLDWAAEHDLPMVLVEAAAMDRPLSVGAALRRGPRRPVGPFAWERPLQDQARAQGTPYLVATEAWADQGLDVEDLRIDTCCHLAPAGHEALAALVLPAIRRSLAAEADP